MAIKTDKGYKTDVIDWGDQTSRLARQMNMATFNSNPAVTVVPLQPGNFRGAVGYLWKPHIYNEMLKAEYDQQTGELKSWVMTEQAECDGAGGKPNFYTLLGMPEAFALLAWEVVTMNVDDFCRTGRFPAIFFNSLCVKRVTEQNWPLVQSTLYGYGHILKQARLVGLTGETAIMKFSVTSCFDTGDPGELALTWEGACVGLAHRDLFYDGSDIKPGMPIVGLWEPTYRCNGGTRLTELLCELYGPETEKIRSNPEAMAFVFKIAQSSLSYGKTMTRLSGWGPSGNIETLPLDIMGAAHVSGGGLFEKGSDILPPGVGAELDNMPIACEVLRDAQRLSLKTSRPISDQEMYSTFHGGCGMIVVLSEKEQEEVFIRECNKDGLKASHIGYTIQDNAPKGQNIHVLSRFLEGGWITG